MGFDSFLPAPDYPVAGDNDTTSKKIRKPYTITKSRQNWTDIEHDKFLEALHLYVYLSLSIYISIFISISIYYKFVCRNDVYILFFKELLFKRNAINKFTRNRGLLY